MDGESGEEKDGLRYAYRGETGSRSEIGSLFQRWGEAYWKERSAIFREEAADVRASVTTSEERKHADFWTIGIWYPMIPIRKWSDYTHIHRYAADKAKCLPLCPVVVQYPTGLLQYPSLSIGYESIWKQYSAYCAKLSSNTKFSVALCSCQQDLKLKKIFKNN